MRYALCVALGRAVNSGLFFYCGQSFSKHAVQPPVSAPALVNPACLSSCATRALVASFGQAQFATTH